MTHRHPENNPVGKRLYPRERLIERSTRDLRDVFECAGDDAKAGIPHTVYAGMTRAEVVATARRTQADIIAELHERALREDYQRGLGSGLNAAPESSLADRTDAYEGLTRRLEP